MKISDIVSFLQEDGFACECVGNTAFDVLHYCMLNQPQTASVTWCKTRKNMICVDFTDVRDLALIAQEPLPDVPAHFCQIVVKDPKAAFFEVVAHFFPHANNPGIAATAVVESKFLGKGVSIGHHSYIGPDVRIGDNVRIGNGVSVECPCVIGNGSEIGSGVVIGTAGYGYYSTPRGELRRVPHTGGVVIGANVDIGANCTIDRGTIGDTVIEDGVKIDNLSFIAHNVHVGKSAMIVGGVIVGGSVNVGDAAYVAPGTVVMNQCRIGARSLVGLGTVVLGNVSPETTVIGNPARKLPPAPHSTANPVWAYGK